MSRNQLAVFCNNWLYIVRHEEAGQSRTPLAHVLNPFRYEILFRNDFLPIIRINRDGWMRHLFSPTGTSDFDRRSA